MFKVKGLQFDLWRPSEGHWPGQSGSTLVCDIATTSPHRDAAAAAQGHGQQGTGQRGQKAAAAKGPEQGTRRRRRGHKQGSSAHQQQGHSRRKAPVQGPRQTTSSQGANSVQGSAAAPEGAPGTVPCLLRLLLHAWTLPRPCDGVGAPAEQAPPGHSVETERGRQAQLEGNLRQE